MTNDTDSSAENQDKPPTTGSLASPKSKLWLCSQAFLQERGMELPHHAVKIWTATQQIKHPRIMVVWMFWSPWDRVYFCLYSFCPLSSTLGVADSWRDETTHPQDPGIKHFLVSISNGAWNWRWVWNLHLRFWKELSIKSQSLSLTQRCCYLSNFVF